VDIEFIAQALQLVSAQGRVPVIAANTGEALTRLADAGHLSKADSKHLLAAWRLLSALRQLQAVFNVTDLSQLKGPEKAALRRMLDITPAALTNRLNSACARTRALFEDLVGALDQPVDQQAVA
jgi:glutamine synthetase adenylyltransferase